MLRLDRVETFYGETQALFGVSLEVGRGEVVALLGANGAGKTTLLRSVLGLTPPRRGRIEFAGRDITRAPTHEIARAGIGWVPDDRRLCPTLSVARNLSIAQKRTRFRYWSVKEAAAIFSPLEYLMERDCENLSGGEMQMVAIARALVGRLKGKLTIVAIEHDMEFLFSLADDISVIHWGQVIARGTPAALKANPWVEASNLGRLN